MSAELKNRIKGKPEITKAAENADGAMELFWKETPGAQKYIVEKFDPAQERFLKIARLPETELTYVDPDVVPGGVYRYRILSKRKNPNGEVLLRRGGVVTATISVRYTVELSEVTHPRFGVVKLSWAPDANADGYRINRRLAETKKALPLAYVEGQKLHYTDRGAVSGQIYFYCVQSFRRTAEDDELIFSRCGQEVMVANLDKTEILEITHGAQRKVTFHVRVTAGIDSFVLYRSDAEDGAYTEVARSKGNTDVTLTDQGAPGAKGAYYVVKCMRRYAGVELFGEPTAPVYVKY